LGSLICKAVSSTFPCNLNAVSLHKLRWRNVRMSIFRQLLIYKLYKKSIHCFGRWRRREW
jgi:hypothetical protein